jgi:hypothetical protein
VIQTRTICFLALAFLAAAPLSLACSSSCVYETELRHSFLVRVTYGNNPLPGAKITIQHVKKKDVDLDAFHGTTGVDGTLRVKLPAGQYIVGGSYLGIRFGFDDVSCFHNSTWSSHKARKQLESSWGDDADSARQIAGQLNISGPARTGNRGYDITRRVDYPIKQAKLTMDGPSIAEPHKTTTDDTGHFSFGALPPGVYVVHVIPGKGSDGFEYQGQDIAMRVDPAAEASGLKVSFGGAICGSASVTSIVDAK